jgi:hypothetical protein
MSTSSRKIITQAMKTDQTKHRKALEQFKGIILHVTSDGVITYPQGRNALWEIDMRLANEYAKRKEIERQEQYEQATTVVIKQKFSEEDLDLVRAALFYETWAQRIKYLECLGYTDLDKNRLKYRLDSLKKSGKWQDIVKVAMIIEA